MGAVIFALIFIPVLFIARFIIEVMIHLEEAKENKKHSEVNPFKKRIWDRT